MQLKSLIFPCALFLTVMTAWLSCGMPGFAMLSPMPIHDEDPWRSGNFSESSGSLRSRCAVRIVAEIQLVRDPWNVISDVHPGDEMTGMYVFTSRAPDTVADPNSASYRFSSAPSGIVVEVGKHRFGTDPRDVEFNIDVDNLDSGDQFSFVSRNNICRPELRNGNCTGQVDLIWWCLHDLTGTALSSDDLPRGPLELANWQSLVGLRIEGTATDLTSNSKATFLIAAKVIRTDIVDP